ncbi:hypothetical protein LINGRAHAP2_LOCUS15562 [Linum grandiflorum]
MILANKCVLCYKCIETVDHIMLHCDYTIKVWAMLTSSLSIHGPRHEFIGDFIRSWKGMNCSPTFSDAMKVIMHATMWSLWLERNERIFKDKENSPRQVFCKVVVNAGNLLGAAGLFSMDKQIVWNRFVVDPG